jgi:hypothetical protein
MLSHTLDEVSIAQAYVGDYGHLGITFDTDQGRVVAIVTNDPEMNILLSNATTLSNQNFKIVGNVKQYVTLVKPRWRKDSLEHYLDQDCPPNPRLLFQKFTQLLGSIIDFEDPICNLLLHDV